ncbi:hypothetical protein FXO38_32445 [Capsicum annuum]|nr:hypothetical protein FXO38_32445 [Capsicum annuum]
MERLIRSSEYLQRLIHLLVVLVLLLLPSLLVIHCPSPMSPDSTEFELRKLSDHIYNANSDHFNVLTILFLLPIASSLVLYPCIHIAHFHPDYFTFPPSQLRLFFSSFKTIVLLVYALLLPLLSLCAVATITYSAFVQAYHNRSINFISSIKSIRKSFFHILSTFIVSHTIYISITLVFMLVLLLSSQILQTFGLIKLKLDLNHLLFLVIFALLVMSPVLLWLQVRWSLAYVIAVVESKWGFETLRRSSAYLVKEKRKVAFVMHLYFGVVVGIMVIGSNAFYVTMMFVLSMVFGWWITPLVMCSMAWWILASQGMRQFLMENVLLYMYCKDCNGEKLPLEIEGKPADEFVYLPLDGEKNQVVV